TNIFYPNTLEQLVLITNDMDIVADAPVPGLPTNSPVMLRYPRFIEPDFGETRRLIQDFRVTSDQSAQSPEEIQSREDRRILFINGVCWPLRTFSECNNYYLGMNCLDPVPSTGTVGSPITFSAAIAAQNGSCTVAGVLVTNHLSPRLQM